MSQADQDARSAASPSLWQRFRSWLHDWIGRDNELMSLESWWELNDERHNEVWHDHDCVCSICEDWDAHDPADALSEEGRFDG